MGVPTAGVMAMRNPFGGSCTASFAHGSGPMDWTGRLGHRGVRVADGSASRGSHRHSSCWPPRRGWPGELPYKLEPACDTEVAGRGRDLDGVTGRIRCAAHQVRKSPRRCNLSNCKCSCQAAVSRIRGSRARSTVSGEWSLTGNHPAASVGRGEPRHWPVLG